MFWNTLLAQNAARLCMSGTWMVIPHSAANASMLLALRMLRSASTRPPPTKRIKAHDLHAQRIRVITTMAPMAPSPMTPSFFPLISGPTKCFLPASTALATPCVPT